GDFDADGDLDVAMANYTGNSTSIMLNNGSGVFALFGTPIPTGTTSWSVVAPDFNGDGILDLAVANKGNSTVSLLLGLGGAQFRSWANLTGFSGAADVFVGDFNNDGAPDLLVANAGNNTVSILLNMAGTKTTLAATPNPSAIGQPITLTATVTPT